MALMGGEGEVRERMVGCIAVFHARFVKLSSTLLGVERRPRSRRQCRI